MVQPCSAKVDAREESWGVVEQLMFPSDISRTVLVGEGLSVPCSLAGPPIIKHLIQIVTYGGWPGWVISISVLPLTKVTG